MTHYTNEQAKQLIEAAFVIRCAQESLGYTLTPGQRSDLLIDQGIAENVENAHWIVDTIYGEVTSE